jgi:hypothetical protein
MLAVLAHTPVPGRHVAALLAVLLEARRHGRRCSPPAPAYLGGVWGGVEARRCLGGNPSGRGMVRPYKVGACGAGRRIGAKAARAVGFGLVLGFCFGAAQEDDGL